MNDITSNPFNLPLNAYAAFDAANLKSLMIQRLNQGGVFTDQIYEGSNFNSLLDIIAYSYNVLLFYLNKTASESTYGQAQIYENMNRIVKALNYNPIGNQTSVLAFKAVAPTTLPPGVYTIPRYSYFTVNGIDYSFAEDATFIKTSNGEEELTQLSNSSLLYQGSFVPYPSYVANGTPFEEFSLAVNTETVNEFIDHSNIHVFVLDETGKYSEWNRVSTLYLENSNSKSYECRLNENQRYVIKFGNDINGKQLKPGSVVSVFYLQSNGNTGEIGPNVLDGNKLFLYNVPSFTQIFSDIKQNLNYITSIQAAGIQFTNPTASTIFSTVEDVNSIRTNAANTFKTQYRLVTTADFETFIRNNFSNVINDVKVVNNWEYLAEHVRYLYNIGLKAPNKDSRVLFNQITFADSCDFNNIYIYIVPKLQTVSSTTNIKANFAGTGLKDNIIDQLQNVKLTTAEVVMMDPVYVAAGIGTASVEEINNNLLTPEIINETKLVIGRLPNSVLSENEIKNQVANIIINYFNTQNVYLGQTLDLDEIVSRILKISGVTSITTVRNNKGQTLQRSGISLLVFNPVYSDPGEDIAIINQSTNLPYFKIPYLYNTSTILNNIEVITPDIQGASVREY